MQTAPPRLNSTPFARQSRVTMRVERLWDLHCMGPIDDVVIKNEVADKVLDLEPKRLKHLIKGVKP